MTHLTEEERQRAADGTLDQRDIAVAAAHAAECAECGNDIARLRALVARVRAEPSRAESLDDVWPAIRARIEQGKVVDLARSARTARRTWRWAAIGVAAAAIFVAWMTHASPPAGSVGAGASTAGARELTAISESTSAYQQEIADRLSDLELRRALLRGETAASIDRDLKVIDRAIGELNDALARDPNNLALRQLLASSLRHKLDLLKRVNNAS